MKYVLNTSGAEHVTAKFVVLAVPHWAPFKGTVQHPMQDMYQLMQR